MHEGKPGVGASRGRLVGAVLGVLGVALAAQAASAQVEIKSRAIELTITGRLHAQWNTTSVDAEEVISNEFLIRRARVTAEVKVNDLVSGKVQPEYGGGSFSLKDAYMELAFDPAFAVRLGQFKRAFDFFELESSTRTLVVERDGVIRGVEACAGVGELCSLSRFTEALEYSDRDIGLGIEGGVEGFGYHVTVTNGTGADASDENDGKSVSGRLEYELIEDLTIGGNVAVHDFVNDTVGDETDYAIAYGGDVHWGNYDEGVHVQLGAVAGDNWRNVNVDGDPSTFATAQGIVTYKAPLENNRFVTAVEPVGRVSWGDPDTSVGGDAGLLLTPGFNVYFTGRNRFSVNVDVYSPSGGDTEWSIKSQMNLHF